MTRPLRSSAPLIGITPEMSGNHSKAARSKQHLTLQLQQHYCTAIEGAGGVPVILSLGASRSKIDRLLPWLDGLVVSGGNFDIHPRHYGERPRAVLGVVKPRRTKFELELIGSALRRDLPILGICGGAQAINVALGGSLYQDIATQLPHASEHQQSARKAIGGHPVRIHPGTLLHRIMKRETLEVNTTHHQAVKRLGTGLIVSAMARDGVIEGIESLNHSFVLGVQWHPEALAQKFALQRRLFLYFVEQCKHSHVGRSRNRSSVFSLPQRKQQAIRRTGNSKPRSRRSHHP